MPLLSAVGISGLQAGEDVKGTITSAILLQVGREALATLSGFLTAGGAPPTAP